MDGLVRDCGPALDQQALEPDKSAVLIEDLIGTVPLKLQLFPVLDQNCLRGQQLGVRVLKLDAEIPDVDRILSRALPASFSLYLVTWP